MGSKDEITGWGFMLVVYTLPDTGIAEDTEDTMPVTAVGTAFCVGIVRRSGGIWCCGIEPPATGCGGLWTACLFGAGSTTSCTVSSNWPLFLPAGPAFSDNGGCSEPLLVGDGKGEPNTRCVGDETPPEKVGVVSVSGEMGRWALSLNSWNRAST